VIEELARLELVSVDPGGAAYTRLPPPRESSVIFAIKMKKLMKNSGVVRKAVDVCNMDWKAMVAKYGNSILRGAHVPKPRKRRRKSKSPFRDSTNSKSGASRVRVR
jgi:hypothetical protein